MKTPSTVLLALAFALGSLAPAALADELVPLRITSQPGEVTINVDRDYVGETGTDKTFEVEPGKHEVLLYKEGFLIELREIEAALGTPIDLHVDLTPDVEVPYGVSIERAPKFVVRRTDGVRYLTEILNLVTEYHVKEVAAGDVVVHIVETLVDGLNKIRARETLLNSKYDPEVRKRLYGAEADLTAYPELVLEKTAGEGRVAFAIRAGQARHDLEVEIARPHRAISSLPDLQAWLRASWDTRGLVSEDAFYFIAVQGLLGFLGDQFTYFISPKDLEEMKIDTSGKLGGLGMQVSKTEDGIEVIAPIEDSPAFDAGILEGDVIIAVGEEPTRDMTLQSAVAKLRGDPGTEVTFTIRRKGSPEPIRMTLKRAIVQIKYIKSRMLDDGIGYIRLTSFMGESVAKDFERALEDLEKQGMRGLVIDLRGNPGGLMNVALDIVDLFVDGGMVFEVRARIDQLSEKHYSKEPGTHGPYPITVLINRGSASASEIVAGILQEKGLAKVVGAKSYGKGSVQRILPLGEEGAPAVALTIALYYLLGRTKVHEVGVQPDYPVEVEPEVEAKIARQSVYSKEDGSIEDARLTKAIEVLQEQLRGK